MRFKVDMAILEITTAELLKFQNLCGNPDVKSRKSTNDMRTMSSYTCDSFQKSTYCALNYQ